MGLSVATTNTMLQAALFVVLDMWYTERDRRVNREREREKERVIGWGGRGYRERERERE